jgi:hypothetical protein
MPVEYFIRYKGLLYDVGTRLKFKAEKYNYYLGIKDGVIEQFIGNAVFIRGDDGELYRYSTIKNLVDFDKVIVEIVEPVYYIPDETVGSKRECPSPWDIETGWIWYIIIMVVGALFKGAPMIWILATVFFFAWKNGKFGGKK